MNRVEKREYAAYTIRPKIHRLLPEYLCPVEPVRLAKPYEGPVSAFHAEVTSGNIPELVESCDVEQGVRPSPSYRGGSAEAKRRLLRFLEKNLRRYASE